MFKNQVKSMLLSQYIQVKKEEYSIYQLIPTKSNKNNSTDSIAALVNKMFIKVDKLIKKEDRKLIIQSYMKASYYIHITKEEVQFYFIVPTVHNMKFRTKFGECWKNIEIKQVDNIPIDINSCSKYELTYTHNDILSLNVDKRSNDLLNANMAVIDILDNDDMTGIFYNFIPTGDREDTYFKKLYRDNIEKFEKGHSLKKTKDIADIGIGALKFIISYFEDFIGSIQSNKQVKKKELFLNVNKIPSSSTKRKASRNICKSQTLVISKSKNKKKEKEIGISMCNSFKSISDDNEFRYKEVKKDIDIMRPVINNIAINKTTVEECQNFISLPGRELIEQYKMINHNKVLERKIPKCLEDGDIRIGMVKCKDTIQKAYYSTDNQISRLGRVLLGSMGAGKDYYMVNMAKDIIAANRGLIVIDYIDQCQLADNIKAITPPDKLLEIDCSNINQLQSFVFNEHKINPSLDDYSKIAIAMQKSEQIQILLDAINDDNTRLTPRMLRYLYAAGTVVFYLKENASFKDVIDTLTNPRKRESLINQLSENAQSILVDELDDLRDLTKTTKSGVENYDSKIDGIIDRVSWLKTNMYTKIAYSKDSSNNIDFVNAINQGKVILIKIPEKQFNSRVIRNVIATFYLSKVWLAKQLGATEIKTELFVNEIHQSYNCQLLMENILVESRKFNLVPTLAMHYLTQCTSKCKNAILASGSSFLLISGCDVKAFNELRTHFEKDGYDETDLVELERYNALCLIKNEDTNYSSFVAKLPA